MREPEKAPEHRLRDDAEEQPESGYHDGWVNTKPSADLAEDRQDAQKGCEAEFDSERVTPRESS